MELLSIPCEILKYKTKDGVFLYGFIQKSKQKNRKIIIHEHGMSGNFYSSTLQLELANGLQGTTYDFFATNNRGSGFINRVKTTNGKKLIGTAFEKFEECVYDIDAAIKVALERGYKEIILSGHSTGCQKIAYYQSKKQNKKVSALLLLAPSDDYGYQKKTLGKNFSKMIAAAKKMIANGKGNEQLFRYENKYSAKRYLSTVSPKLPETELFNYTGKLKLFSKVKCPIFAMFGSKEEYLAKPPKECLRLLREKTSSKKLITVEIEGSNHQFVGYEEEAVENVLAFLKTV